MLGQRLRGCDKPKADGWDGLDRRRRQRQDRQGLRGSLGGISGGQLNGQPWGDSRGVYITGEGSGSGAGVALRGQSEKEACVQAEVQSGGIWKRGNVNVGSVRQERGGTRNWG